MGTGSLTVQARTAGGALPVANAKVTVTGQNGDILYETNTGVSGDTGYFSLTAPDMEHTLDPNYREPAYSVCDVTVSAPGFVTEHISNVEIVDTQRSILPVHMRPLAGEARRGAGNAGESAETVSVPPVGLLLPANYRKEGPPDERQTGRVLNRVVIPRYITVHLGAPTNTAARNIRIPFSEYIKNVTSSEIYSTWPYNAIVANIHVIVTFALNRIYTEWYRSRGYPFDITNSTSYDQYYREGGVIFENISRIVDDIFNIYAKREGYANPFFTQFCNGTTVTCPGLSQWGTVTLADRGMTPLEILHYYYPDDLVLEESNQITDVLESYPGSALRMGSRGEAVRHMQEYLNRIRVNYPGIPAIGNPNGVFDEATQNAVKTFQQAFNLTPDGIVGRATWNKINAIYVGVTRLGELDSEGIRDSIGQNPPDAVLSQGSRGENVRELQFILNTVAEYYNTVPFVVQDGIFGPSVKNAVMEFQQTFGLTPDGVVGPGTWNKLYSVYRGIEDSVPNQPGGTPQQPGAPAYPGTPLKTGSSGNSVRLMQSYLNAIRAWYPSIPYLREDGVFGDGTRRAVAAFQDQFMLTPDGIIGPVTWNKIAAQYAAVTGGAPESPARYPGTPLRVGASGESVRIMQQNLSDLSQRYPSLPSVAADGDFGTNTRAAVMAFQRLFGLTPDGIIGPATWNAIVTRHSAL